MPDRIIELYDRSALGWDAARGQTLGAERVWMDRLTAGIPIGGTILDLGCGTGDPVARAFLQQGFRITGVESSPNLVAIAKGRLPEAEWIVADMPRLDLKRRLDAVLAWHSFFHLTQDDQRRMFPVFAAHTAPGGALVFTSGPRAGPSIGERQGEPLFHDSLDPAEYKGSLATFGFELRQHIAEDPECGGATFWLADKSRGGGVRRIDAREDGSIQLVPGDGQQSWAAMRMSESGRKRNGRLPEPKAGKRTSPPTR